MAILPLNFLLYLSCHAKSMIEPRGFDGRRSAYAALLWHG
jgi:hypothetical protein